MHNALINFDIGTTVADYEDKFMPESQILTKFVLRLKNAGHWQWEIDMAMDENQQWKQVTDRLKAHNNVDAPIYITVLWYDPMLKIRHYDTRMVIDFGWSYLPLDYQDTDSIAGVKLFMTMQEPVRINGAPAIVGRINT
jgi:hypothetical protein